jgi:hypothetical protein
MSYPTQATEFSPGTVYSSTWGNWVNKKAVAEINLVDYLTSAQLQDGIACTASIDITSALQAAIDAAYTQVITQTVFDEYGWQSRGGATVYIPRGKFLISGQIVLKANVSLKGQGKSSSCFYCTYNGDVFTAVTLKAGEYNPAGISLEDLFLLGDKTKTSQKMLNLNRPVGMKIRGVVINSAGSDGATFREVSNSLVEDFEVANCGGKGVIWTHGDTSLPSNANLMINPRIMYNDQDGLSLEGQVNGLTVIGGSIERNGYASNGVGYYNVKITCLGIQIVHILNVWTEGPCEAHLYVNLPSTGGIVRVTGLKHFAEGTAALPNRAVIVDRGTVFIEQATGNSSQYKTYLGTSVPFQVHKTNGLLFVIDCSGNSASGISFACDETGATTGLFSCYKQNNFGSIYGPQIIYSDNGAGNGLELRTDTAATYPWFNMNTFYKRMEFGGGAAAPDVSLERKSADLLGMTAGDSFSIDGTYNGGTLRLRNSYLWVDGSGRLRIKATAPTSDTDGTVVGTQT